MIPLLRAYCFPLFNSWRSHFARCTFACVAALFVHCVRCPVQNRTYTHIKGQVLCFSMIYSIQFAQSPGLVSSVAGLCMPICVCVCRVALGAGQIAYSKVKFASCSQWSYMQRKFPELDSRLLPLYCVLFCFCHVHCKSEVS